MGKTRAAAVMTLALVGSCASGLMVATRPVVRHHPAVGGANLLVGLIATPYLTAQIDGTGDSATIITVSSFVVDLVLACGLWVDDVFSR